MVLGLSGGLDSTHALIVAARAMDREGRPPLSVLITTSIGAPSLSVFLQEGLRNRGVDPAACDCWRGLRLSEARASFSSDLADATRSSAATLRTSRSS
jgi:NH3-dependent NAD+ synthetase